ncbi:MAG: phosphocholine cytidylyltransferase family protein [Gammaproteobacteria bacterium]
MKVIIMAAGVGNRLKEIHGVIPKCLIAAGNGKTLISRIVDIFHDKGIQDIAVILGYQAATIRKELKNDVRYFENKNYLTTNSIMSLWYAKEMLDDDVILLNADLFYEPQLLDDMLRQDHKATMLADSTRIVDADYRFGFKGNRICRFGKQLTNQETDGEYVGMARIDKGFIKSFKNKLETMIDAGDTNAWWENVLYSFINDRISINYFDIAGTFWTEVDTAKDYKRLNDWIENDRRLNLKAISLKAKH